MKVGKWILSILVLASIVSCNKEPFVSVESNADRTINKFDFTLQNTIIDLESIEDNFIFDYNDSLIVFNENYSRIDEIKVNSILFSRSLSSEFNVAKFGRKVRSIEKKESLIYVNTVEPELASIYEHFYLDIFNLNNLTIRTEPEDTLTHQNIPISSTAGFLQIQFPINPNVKVITNFGGTSFDVDFKWGMQTEFLSNNSLVNTRVIIRDLALQNIALNASIEVKNTTKTSSSTDPKVAVLANQSSLELRRNTFFTSPGIPLALNFDVGSGMEAGVSGKIAASVPLVNMLWDGDFIFNIPVWDLFLATIPTTSINLNSFVGTIEEVPNITSYPVPNGCINIDGDLNGFAKAFLSLGFSVSAPLPLATPAVGVYFDIFTKLTGGISTEVCVPDNNVSGDFCIEYKGGVSTPYIMATVNTNPSKAKHNSYKLGFSGQNIDFFSLTFPEECDPLSLIDFISIEDFVTPWCNDEMVFIDISIAKPPVFMESEFFNLYFNNGVIISSLHYDEINSINLTDFLSPDDLQADTLFFDILDVNEDRVFSQGNIILQNCSTLGCLPVLDLGQNLPTYPDQIYCSFIPQIDNYNRRWIKENMYYTTIHRDHPNLDSYTDGRTYQNASLNQAKNYGRLYTYEACNNPRSLGSFTDWQDNICPQGYHIPSFQEWFQLIESADAWGNPSILLSESWPGVSSNNTNSSDFSIRPLGYYTEGGNNGEGAFTGINQKTYFWTSDQVIGAASDTSAWAVEVTSDEISLVKSTKSQGYYCRCIED